MGGNESKIEGEGARAGICEREEMNANAKSECGLWYQYQYHIAIIVRNTESCCSHPLPFAEDRKGNHSDCRGIPCLLWRYCVAEISAIRTVLVMMIFGRCYGYGGGDGDVVVVERIANESFQLVVRSVVACAVRARSAQADYVV